ncbi:methylated-DNA--[protein]-cysteine S-methyltransferase [Acetobacteraceae bacterium]|nr:methylated-DNA--[protein]-cysteine S-methyltransferase [Acetobacteraceae bacterium]
MGQKSFHTPLGEITLSADDFGEGNGLVSLDEGWGRDQESEDSLLNQAEEMLQAYFDGECRDFSSLPFKPFGTDFQKRVWAEISKIPYGETMSYGDIAKILNSSPRAVGTATGRNPLPILVPCHRVLPKNGKIGEYSFGDGADTKEYLLNLEKHFLDNKSAV